MRSSALLALALALVGCYTRAEPAPQQSPPTLTAINAPYGRYSFEGIVSLAEMTGDGKPIKPCGATGKLPSPFDQLDIVFSTDGVQINARRWIYVQRSRSELELKFGSKSSVNAISPDSSASVQVQVSFHKTGPQKASGMLTYRILENGRPACLSGAPLRGIYQPAS